MAAERGKAGELVSAVRQRLRRVNAGLLKWFLRLAPSERRRLFLLTIVVGIASGLVAVAFHIALRETEAFVFQRLVPAAGRYWWLVAVAAPALGGIISGVLLLFVPDARGSGVPEVKAAYAKSGGRITVRTMAGKFLISLIQIGSGASLGREGPTVQICAGIATLTGRLGALSRQAVRRMLPVGAAAGIAAAFNAPIAAVTFVIEEVIGDLDQAVLAGVVIAAALAAAIERTVLGAHPAIPISHEYTLEHNSSLLLYALLGVLAAVASILFTDGLLKLRGRFNVLEAIPRWAQPAVGGLVTGVLAVIALWWVHADGVTGGGYQTLADALSGGLAVRAMLVLCVFKLVATVASYGTGGSGGIFAPSLFIGGMLGGAVGVLNQELLATSSEQVGAFALVGMGAVFAGIIRAPITSVLIIFEMTNGYSLILPLMIANMTAYALATRWRPVPIYEALLQQDGIFIPHAHDVNPLAKMPVGAVMTTKAVRIPANVSVAEALEKIASQEYALYPVVDDAGQFRGFANRYHLRKAASDGKGTAPVVEFVSKRDHVYPETPVMRAIVRLNQLGVHLLAVVDPENQKFLGLLTTSDVVRAQAGMNPDLEDSQRGDAPST
ncbi:MAG: chloride channel protein [Thermoanaerobaculia bacterium]